MTTEEKFQLIDTVSADTLLTPLEKLRRIIYTCYMDKPISDYREYNYRISCPFCGTAYNDSNVPEDEMITIFAESDGKVYWEWSCPYCGKEIAKTYTYEKIGQSTLEMLEERREELYDWYRDIQDKYKIANEIYTNIVNAIYDLDNRTI